MRDFGCDLTRKAAGGRRQQSPTLSFPFKAAAIFCPRYLAHLCLTDLDAISPIPSSPGDDIFVGYELTSMCVSIVSPECSPRSPSTNISKVSPLSRPTNPRSLSCRVPTRPHRTPQDQSTTSHYLVPKRKYSYPPSVAIKDLEQYDKFHNHRSQFCSGMLAGSRGTTRTKSETGRCQGRAAALGAAGIDPSQAIQPWSYIPLSSMRCCPRRSMPVSHDIVVDNLLLFGP